MFVNGMLNRQYPGLPIAGFGTSGTKGYLLYENYTYNAPWDAVTVAESSAQNVRTVWLTWDGTAIENYENPNAGQTAAPIKSKYHTNPDIGWPPDDVASAGSWAGGAAYQGPFLAPHPCGHNAFVGQLSNGTGNVKTPFCVSRYQEHDSLANGSIVVGYVTGSTIWPQSAADVDTTGIASCPTGLAYATTFEAHASYYSLYITIPTTPDATSAINLTLLANTSGISSPTFRSTSFSSTVGTGTAQLAVIASGDTDKLKIYDIDYIPATPTATLNTGWNAGTPPSAPTGAFTSIAWEPYGDKLVICSVGSQPYVYDTSSEPYTSSTPSALSTLPTQGKVYWNDNLTNPKVFFYSEQGDGTGVSAGKNFHVFDPSTWTLLHAGNLPSGANLPTTLMDRSVKWVGTILGLQTASGGRPAIGKLMDDGTALWVAWMYHDELLTTDDTLFTSVAPYTHHAIHGFHFFYEDNSTGRNHAKWVNADAYFRAGIDGGLDWDMSTTTWPFVCYYEDSDQDLWVFRGAYNTIPGAAQSTIVKWDKATEQLITTGLGTVSYINGSASQHAGGWVDQDTGELYITYDNTGSNTPRYIMEKKTSIENSVSTGTGYMRCSTGGAFEDYDRAMNAAVMTRDKQNFMVNLYNTTIPVVQFVVVSTTLVNGDFTINTDWNAGSLTMPADAGGSGPQQYFFTVHPFEDKVAIWEAGQSTNDVNSFCIWDTSTTQWTNVVANTLTDMDKLDPENAWWTEDGHYLVVTGSHQSASGGTSNVLVYDATSSYARVAQSAIANLSIHTGQDTRPMTFVPRNVKPDTNQNQFPYYL